MTDAFRRWTLDAVDPSFDELLGSVRFDDVTTGRRGTVLVKVDAGGVPIVRTTTSYQAPAQPFQPVHDRIAEAVRSIASLPQPFNNALVEHYTRAYGTMKFHSDQALDLAASSSIAVYSRYRDPSRPSRRLTVKPKGAGEAFDVLLEHGSVVVFSLADNARFRHRIALVANAPDNDWFGITFRTSKTFLRFVDGRPTLPSGEPLTLATEDERRAFFQMRRRENEEVEFAYPPIPYALSESDLMLPAGSAAMTPLDRTR